MIYSRSARRAQRRGKSNPGGVPTSVGAVRRRGADRLTPIGHPTMLRCPRLHGRGRSELRRDHLVAVAGACAGGWQAPPSPATSRDDSLHSARILAGPRRTARFALRGGVCYS